MRPLFLWVKNMSKVEFVNFDDPFVELKFEGENYVYNPEYGTLLSVSTDKIVENVPVEIQAFLHKFYQIQESF